MGGIVLRRTRQPAVENQVEFNLLRVSGRVKTNLVDIDEHDVLHRCMLEHLMHDTPISSSNNQHLLWVREACKHLWMHKRVGGTNGIERVGLRRKSQQLTKKVGWLDTFFA